MKRKGKKRVMTLAAALLLAVFFVSLTPGAAFADDAEPLPDNRTSNTTLHGEYGRNSGNHVTVAADASLDTNTGTVSLNDGEIDGNGELITLSYGGSALYYLGNGTVVENGETGVIQNNHDVVTTNNGTIVNNLYRHVNGHVGVNGETGVIQNNYGVVSTNNGIIGNNSNEENGGYVKVNSETGKILNNTSMVKENYGYVKNGENGHVENNFGGTVSNPDGTVNTENQSFRVDVREIDGEAKDFTNAVNDSKGNPFAMPGSGATVTARERDDAEISWKGSAVVDASLSGDTWTFLLSNIGSNIKFYYASLGPSLEELQQQAWAKWAAMIREAPQGAELKIDGGIWPSLNKEVGRALAERSDVSVTFSTYSVEGHTVTIPAGTDLLGMLGNAGIISFADIAAALK